MGDDHVCKTLSDLTNINLYFIVAAIQEVMEANVERSSGEHDLVEIQLKKAQTVITGLQEDKERLSQVYKQVHISFSMYFI